MDVDTIKKMLFEKINSSVEPNLPEALNDIRLEDAFKKPIYDGEGYAASMPVVWDSSSYGKKSDGVKILSLRSARSASGLYSKFLDEEALVWDAAKQELFLYVPDEKNPAVAFKGSSWLCAKKLKPENIHLNLYDVYKELQIEIKAELGLKNKDL
jgi:hypothetical protein